MQSTDPGRKCSPIGRHHPHHIEFVGPEENEKDNEDEQEGQAGGAGGGRRRYRTSRRRYWR